MKKDFINIFTESWKRVLITFAVLTVIVTACEAAFGPSQIKSARIFYIVLVCLSIPDDYFHSRKKLRASRSASFSFAALYALVTIVYVFTLKAVIHTFM